MAENKEITTLHPYMNRNKNRYPNVKDENIPDTIQRKMTAGTGINISPDNVISATGGDSYTRSETDALLDTKADKVSLENVNKVVPTDIAVKDGKLGLKHDTAWLTNQNAINLGENITYDDGTNTLNASGGKLPVGSKSDPVKINKINLYAESNVVYFDQGNYEYYKHTLSRSNGLNVEYRSAEQKAAIKFELNVSGGYGSAKVALIVKGTNQISLPNHKYYLVSDNKYNGDEYIPVLAHPTIDGTYNLQITKNENSYHYDWVAGGGYNHYIVITDGTASNAIYLLIPSTNNLICNILTDLDTLLGSEPRFIQASGVVTDTASKLPIVAIKWQGSFSSSKIVTMSSEKATTKFTDIVDVVEPA